MMKRISTYWKALALPLMMGAAMTSCDLLDTPEYPDDDFSIVGTWEYQIPPLEGSAPRPGQVYNATGWVTFTEDMRFCFTLDTDQGEVKSYGVYNYDEDSGIFLYYEEYMKMDIPSYEPEDFDLHRTGYQSLISWGNNDAGDVVSDDYLKVHSRTVGEYHRVATREYEEEIVPYIYGEDYHYVTHDGYSLVDLPINPK